uniref:Reverse transcriptase Ty1/copia-type domain-containing protein n=1 Tax=Tanacetum cinerariifolium TaxID=118510 RepID=A0A6L2MMI0_TANCI|nr:hypothetical protein [Tanacetum cinerariifolium]
MDGKVHTYKARLVAKDYTQTHRIDYEETFSPVAKIKSIRIMLAIAAFYDYEIWHMDVKTASINGKLTEDVMSRVPYALAVGSIMYAMMCTRTDVSFALGMLSRHQHNPGEGHWSVVKNILKYLRNTKDKFLVYGGEKELRVTGAMTWKSSKQDIVAESTCDSEYIAACEASIEPIWMTNFVEDLGVVPIVKDPIEILCDNESAVALTKEPKDHEKGAMTWKSSKQDIVAESTCDSEYIAACEASIEPIWMTNFVEDLGVVPIVKDPIEILCDNESAVALTKEPKDHEKSKHIERKYYFV